MTPSGFKTFGFDPHFGGLLLSKKIEGNVTEYRQIVVSMPDTDAWFIFPKSDIQHPMHTIFDPPIAANRRCKAVDISGKTEQVPYLLERETTFLLQKMSYHRILVSALLLRVR